MIEFEDVGADVDPAADDLILRLLFYIVPDVILATRELLLM